MKRLITLAFLAAFVLGTVATASAIVDVKASGSWRVSASWFSGSDLIDDAGDATSSDEQSNFEIRQRVRTAFQFIANENLRGVWHIEIGAANWGQTAYAPGMDRTGIIETKQAYIDFVIPNTEINIMAGGLPLALPSGYPGSPVLDNDVAALVLSTPLFDGVGLIAGYARLGDFGVGTNDTTEFVDSYLDAFVLAVPLNFDWLTLTPYMMFAWSGDRWLEDLTQGETSYANIPDGLVSQNASLWTDDAAGTDASNYDDVDVWWGGMAFGLNLDPVMIDGHFVYGSLEGQQNLDRAGWEADLAITYTGFDFMTPRLVFMWTSGEDGNGSDNDNDGDGDHGESERLPVVAMAGGSTNFWDGGGIIGDGIDTVSGLGDAQMVGYWTLGLEVNDVSFIDNLTHDFSIFYIEGTNDTNLATNENGNAGGAAANPYGQGVAYGTTLTDDDSMWEYVIRTEYQMYDQLTFILSLGYLDVDMDQDDGGASGWAVLNGDEDDDDATKVLLGVRYDF